jgi:3-oxoacyl-[acyl-carrier protein] reductase
MTRVLEGKCALVTGGARGLGRGMVERLAASGAFVAFNYARNTIAAQECVAQVEREGGRALALKAELSTTQSIEAFVATLNAELFRGTGQSKLDILVNNIGGGAYGTIPSTSAELFDTTFSNNVRVPFLLTAALVPRLRDGGRVINISSVASRLAGVDFAVYSMSKAALDMFTRTLAKELGPRRIPVNGVAPGFNETDTNADVMSDPAVRKQIEDMTAMGRFGTAGDIAEVVHWLASPAGGWVTGQIIEASGGFRM